MVKLSNDFGHGKRTIGTVGGRGKVSVYLPAFCGVCWSIHKTSAWTTEGIYKMFSYLWIEAGFRKKIMAQSLTTVGEDIRSLSVFWGLFKREKPWKVAFFSSGSLGKYIDPRKTAL